MDNSPLGKLSPELRNIISTMVLKRDQIFVIPTQRGSGTRIRYIQGGDDSDNYPMALAHTCKQARIECTQMYYAINSFTVKHDHLNYEQFCAFFKDFTKSGELKLKHCSTTQDLDHLDEEEMLITLRGAIMNIPHHGRDGLESLDATAQQFTLVGSTQSVIWESANLAVNVYIAMGLLMHRMMASGVMALASSHQHGPNCCTRAAKMVLCLSKCTQELIIADDFAGDLPEKLGDDGEPIDRVRLLEKLMTSLTDLNALLRDYITAQLTYEDVPCTHQVCLAKEEAKRK